MCIERGYWNQFIFFCKKACFLNIDFVIMRLGRGKQRRDNETCSSCFYVARMRVIVESSWLLPILMPIFLVTFFFVMLREFDVKIHRKHCTEIYKNVRPEPVEGLLSLCKNILINKNRWINQVTIQFMQILKIANSESMENYHVSRNYFRNVNRNINENPQF